MMSLSQKVKVWLQKKLAVKTSDFSIIDLLQQRDFKLSSSFSLKASRFRHSMIHFVAVSMTISRNNNLSIQFNLLQDAIEGQKEERQEWASDSDR